MDAHTQNPKPLLTDFLSLVEFAELLGISKTTAYELAQRNELPVPVLRIGRQYRVSRKAYEALKDAQHVRNLDDAA
jgi:excisionase family DNA binding protein